MDKKASEILEIDINETEEPEEIETDEEGFGISRKPAKKMAKRVAFVVCPLCSMSRKLDKTGSYSIRSRKKKGGIPRQTPKEYRSLIHNPEKQTTFNSYKFTEPFISLRVSRGRNAGMPEVEIIRYKDIPKITSEKDKLVLLDIVKEIREQCKIILEETKFLKVE